MKRLRSQCDALLLVVADEQLLEAKAVLIGGDPKMNLWDRMRKAGIRPSSKAAITMDDEPILGGRMLLVETSMSGCWIEAQVARPCCMPDQRISEDEGARLCPVSLMGEHDWAVLVARQARNLLGQID